MSQKFIFVFSKLKKKTNKKLLKKFGKKKIKVDINFFFFFKLMEEEWFWVLYWDWEIHLKKKNSNSILNNFYPNAKFLYINLPKNNPRTFQRSQKKKKKNPQSMAKPDLQSRKTQSPNSSIPRSKDPKHKYCNENFPNKLNPEQLKNTKQLKNWIRPLLTTYRTRRCACRDENE